MRVVPLVIGMLLSTLFVWGRQPAANDPEANKALAQRAFQAFNQGDSQDFERCIRSERPNPRRQRAGQSSGRTVY
jgi:hypothetical protein